MALLSGPTLLQFAAYVLSYDLWFYGVHRMLHSPRFYKTFHSQHHKHVHPTFQDTFVASATENTLSGLGIVIPLVLFQEPSFPSFGVAWFFCLVRGILRHDPRASWIVGSHHLDHHMHPNCNFSSLYVDRVFGTAL